MTMMIHYKLKKLLLCVVEGNTQLIPPVPKANIHCFTVSACVEWRYVVVVVHDLVLGPDDEVCGKSLSTMRMKVLSTWVFLFGHTRLLYGGIFLHKCFGDQQKS